MKNLLIRTSLVLMLFCASHFSLSAFDFCVDGIFYNITDDSACTVEVTSEELDAQNYSGAVVIPSNVEYNGINYSVTGIGEYAFFKCSELSSIVLPETLTSIGKGAFFRCTLIEEINIPDSVSDIGSSAFSWCTSIKNITLPESVTEIKDWVFDCCDSLETVTMSSALKSIGQSAFYSCSSLKSIELGESVESITSSAFFACTSLESVVVPEAVTIIEDRVFAQCTSLKEVKIGSQVTELSKYAFLNCTSLEKFVCMAVNDPKADTTSEGTFSRSNISNATLYVPEGSMVKYMLSEPWSEFGSIEETTPMPAIVITNIRRGPTENSTSTFTCTVKCKNTDYLYIEVVDENNTTLGNYSYESPEDVRVETDAFSSLCNGKVTFKAINEVGEIVKVVEFNPALPDGLYYSGTDGRIYVLDNEGNTSVLTNEEFPHTFQLVQIRDRIYGTSAGENFTWVTNPTINGDGKLFYLFNQNNGELGTNIILDNTGGDNNRDPYGLANYGDDIYVYDRNEAIIKLGYGDQSISQDYPSWLKNNWLSFYGRGWTYGCIKSNLQITDGDDAPMFWLMMSAGGNGLFLFMEESINPRNYRAPYRDSGYLIGIRSTAFYADQANDDLYVYMMDKYHQSGLYRIKLSSLMSYKSYKDYTFELIDGSPLASEGTFDEPAGVRQLSVDANGEYLYWCYRAPTSSSYDEFSWHEDYDPKNPLHHSGIKRIKLGQEHPVVEMVAEGVEAYGVVPVNFTRGNESSVQDIVADPEENAPVEYYNLQGMRILNPQPGTFVIKRQGNKVEKIIY